MRKFAVLIGNTVFNVALSDTKENAELATGQVCVEYTDENPVGIGWTYDGKKFIPPYVAPTDYIDAEIVEKPKEIE